MTTIDNIMALAMKAANAELAWDIASGKYPHDKQIHGVDESIEALRTALTEAFAKDVSLIDEGNKAQPVREPLAWWITGKKTDEKFVTTRPDDWSNKNWNKHQLYAAPQPVREPLSNDHIERLRDQTFSINNPFCPVDSKSMRKAVRAAERAHGIGGDK